MDYSAKTTAELKKLMTEKNIKNRSKITKKDDMIAALSSSDTEGQQPQERQESPKRVKKVDPEVIRDAINKMLIEEDEQIVAIREKINEFLTELTAPKRREKKTKSADGKKRPLNAYMKWVNESRADFKERYPDLKPTELAKKMGEEWRSMDEEEKAKYKPASSSESEGEKKLTTKKRGGKKETKSSTEETPKNSSGSETEKVVRRRKGKVSSDEENKKTKVIKKKNIKLVPIKKEDDLVTTDEE
jgi:hypothetical protein